MRDFDDSFNRILAGYQTLQDYFAAASLLPKVHHVDRPTIFLNASDDMFSPERGNAQFSNRS
jgi:predicted alpha/beta-fold hydrolase